MKILRIMLPLVIGIALVTVVITTGTTQADSTATTQGFITEYPIPTATNGEPRNIVTEAPGRVWFTLPLSNAIGSLVVTSTTDYQFTLYDVPTPNSDPYDLAYDEDGNALWFTQRAGNKIGRLHISTGIITETAAISTTNVAPTGILVAADGKVWFTERDGNKLANFDPAAESFTEYSYSTPGGLFEDLDIDAQGLIWLTAPGLDRVIEFDTNSNEFGEEAIVNDPFVDPNDTWSPGNIAIDQFRNPWITVPTEDRIGRYIPATSTFWFWYPLGTTGNEPAGIDVTANGNGRIVWFVETNAGRVVQMGISSTGSKLYQRPQPLPTVDSQPLGIAVDSAGNAWITESGTNQIAQWSPPYFNFTYLPFVIKQ